MKIQKLKNIKKKPLIFAIVLLIAGVIGLTYAYYTSETRLLNKFTVATYNVKLEEEGFTGNFGTKKVYIANNESTNTPVVVRFNYNELWTKTVDGVLLTLSNNYNGTNVVTKNWAAGYNDFTLGSDGWYYYKKVLNPQQKVQILESITKNTPANIYDGYDYKLIFNYEAIQADAAAVSSIWGKNITISNGNVTWSL